MTPSHGSSERENTYLFDAEDSTEMARLLHQDVLATRSMGGLFSEREGDLTGIQSILDVACGPGGWVLDVAREYPEVEVTGIDISERMINYARAHAQARGLPNAHFEVMNILEPLKFADGSFDLVNARLLVVVLTPETWPGVLRELVRVCRPAGTIRLTEFEMAITNSPAFEKLIGLGLQALRRVKRTFSPDGRYFGITPMLGYLLQQAGCRDIQFKVHAIDSSSGTEAHEAYVQDMMAATQQVLPFLLKTGAITQEEFEWTYQQMVAEMLADDFRAISYGLTVWGTRP